MIVLSIFLSISLVNPYSQSFTEGVRLLSFEELSRFANTVASNKKLMQFYAAWEVKEGVEVGRELYIEKAVRENRRLPVLYKWNIKEKVWTKESSGHYHQINLGERTYYKINVTGPGIYALFDLVRNQGKSMFKMANGYKMISYKLVQPSAGIILEEHFKHKVRSGTIRFGQISPQAQLQLRLDSPKGEVQMNTLAGSWMKVPFFYSNKYVLYFSAAGIKKVRNNNFETLTVSSN